jgi:DNA repair exonuclease SbcCD ATPase subunit
MQFVRIELYNVCQHAPSLCVDFSAGLTAVVGPNGSGKTNLINMGYAVITGDFSRNEGTKEKNVAYGAGKGDKSGAVLHLTHAGNSLVVERWLQPDSARLTITTPAGATTVITKKTEIDEKLAGLLGVTSRLLSDYVFVDQWSVFGILTMRPADRAKALQRLFQTDLAEQLYKIVDAEQKAGLKAPTVTLDRDVVLARVAHSKDRLGVLSDKFTRLSQAAIKSDTERHRRVMRDWENKEILTRKLQDLVKERDVLEIQVSDAGKIFDRDTAELGARSAQLANWAQDEDYLREAQANYKLYAERSAKLAALSKRLSGIQEKLVYDNPPERPEAYVAPESSNDDRWFWDEYNAHAKKVANCSHFLSLLKDSDSQCPTCGTPRETLAVHRAEYENDLKKSEEYLLGAHTVLEASRAYDKKLHNYEMAQAQLKAEEARIVASLDDLDPGETPSYSLEDITNDLGRITSLRSEVELCRKRLDESGSVLRNRKSRLDALNDTVIADTVKGIERLAATRNDHDNSRRAVAEAEALVAELANTKAELGMLKRTISDDELALANHDKAVKRAEQAKEWHDYCDSLKAVFHRDGLPKKIAERYMEELRKEVDALLHDFDSPFRVECDEELSFTAVFKDGKRTPAARLSGGEKVMLAIAFRVAVNSMFAKDLGLLVLDEPTAGLDADNLGCLRVAISRLKEMAASTGLQLIMITHEQGIAHMFDHTIALKGKN